MTCDPCQTGGSLTPPIPLGKLTEEEGIKGVPAGDEQAKEAVGAAQDEMDPGTALEGRVWAQCVCYLLTTKHSTEHLGAGAGRLAALDGQTPRPAPGEARRGSAGPTPPPPDHVSFLTELAQVTS